MQTTAVQRALISAGVVGAGAVGGAVVASITPSSDEGRQTFLSTLVAAGTLGTAVAVIRSPRAAADTAARLDGLLVPQVCLALSGAALGSFIVDLSNG